MNLDLALLVSYAILQIALGVFIGRLVRSTSSFFVAGRQLGPGLLFSTLLAANIGAGSTVGAAGLGYRDGLSAWWWVGSAGIGSLVLAGWVGPKIWEVASREGFLTVGDFLEKRYGASVRAVLSALLWAGTLAILASQLIAMSRVLAVVARVPRNTGCIIGGAVMTAYFTAGGLLSSAWVNLVQLVVLLLGFSLALPFALQNIGGWSHLAAAVPQDGGYSSFWQGGASGWHYLVLLGPAFVISPGLLQKVYGARDKVTVRRSVAANAFVLLVFAWIPPILGMIARARHSGLANPELALPTVLLRELPKGLGSLGLAAIFSAEVSTADAILFMLATSLSQDLYRRFLRPTATDGDVLRVARLAALAGGVLGVLLSIVIPTVIEGLTIFYSLLGVSLFVPVVVGLYSRRGGSAEALASIGAGVTVMLAARFWGAAGFFRPNLLGLMAAAATFFLVAMARGERTDK